MNESAFDISLVQVGPNTGDYPARTCPLGLMMLAACVERDVPGARARITDMKVAREAPEELYRRAFSGAPRVIGLSALSIHAPMLESAAAEARAAAPDAFIVAGGPHTTCFPARVLENPAIDAVVIGEGERAFTNLVRAIMEGTPPESVRGVAGRARPDFSERDVIDSLDSLPFPAWDKVDIGAYSAHPSFAFISGRRYMSLFTSRGCPYNCVYCHNVFGKKFRARPAVSVIEEIRTLGEKYGIHDIEVIDDAFNISRARVVEICEGLIAARSRARLYFPNGMRADRLDEELIRLLRRAGTVYLGFAVETASPRLQKLIDKNLDIEKVAAAIRAASRMGIYCAAFFMAGFPTETEAELAATLDLAARLPIQSAHILKATPYEGTRLREMLSDEVKALIEKNPDWLRYDNLDFNLSEIPAARFKAMLRAAYFRLYFNPLRILSILRRYPGKVGLLRMLPYSLKRIFVRTQ